MGAGRKTSKSTRVDLRMRHDVLGALKQEAEKRKVPYTSLLQEFAEETLKALGYKFEEEKRSPLPLAPLPVPSKDEPILDDDILSILEGIK